VARCWSDGPAADNGKVPESDARVRRLANLAVAAAGTAGHEPVIEPRRPFRETVNSAYNAHVMILFLHGEDTYRSLRKLGEIRAKFLRDVDPSGLNVADLDAHNQDLGELQAAVSAMPFLAKKRLVVARHFIEETGKKEAEALAAMLKKIPEETILVVYESASAKDLSDSPAFEPLKKLQHYPEFSPLAGRNLSEWVRAEAKSREFEFEPASFEAYLASAGNDLWRLSGELDKLSAYAAATSRTIDASALAALTELQVESDLFGFIDAMAVGDAARAAELLEVLLDQGGSEVMLLSRLQSHVRNLLLAADISSTGQMTKDRLAKELGVHPFVAGKLAAQVRRFDFARLKAAYLSLIDADLKLKTGGWATPRLALDLFLLEQAI
jgi:DNA polymerase-3 subunit delta